MRKAKWTLVIAGIFSVLLVTLVLIFWYGPFSPASNEESVTVNESGLEQISEQWDFYFCNVDDKQASIFVDLGIHDKAPKPHLPIMGYIKLYLKDPRDNGWPGGEELDFLNKIEDEIEKRQAPNKILYVGRITCNGYREFFFYIDDDTKIEEIARVVFARFPECKYETGSRQDSNWSVYFDFLYPSPKAYQVMSNRWVIDRLERNGDDPNIIREVRHWVYFKSKEHRATYLDIVKNRGFRIDSTRTVRGKERPYEAIISKEQKTHWDRINDTTLLLFDLAVKFEAEYDGWETQGKRGKELAIRNERVQVLGAYRLEPSKELFDKAWQIKYGGTHLSRKDRERNEYALRQELSSVVLLEVLVKDVDENFDVSDFAQKDSDQAAYIEVYLSEDGTAVISDLHRPEADALRIAFYLHFFDVQKELQTSYGPAEVPSIREMPNRLEKLLPYEPVD